MFKILKNNMRLEYKTFLFPGGEVGLKLDAENHRYKSEKAPYQTIVARLTDSDEVMYLLMLVDALKRFDPTPINLFMPYVPYARQDRVCNKGESFSLKVFINLINSLPLNKVTICDPHSEVSTALFNHPLEVITQKDIVSEFADFNLAVMSNNAIFVSPDAGGNKKTSDVASEFGATNFIRADKLRDLSNGNIKETIVYADDLTGQTVVIADDICDGGRTFIELAKVLKAKNAKAVFLYVTHGIFSKGVDVLLNNGIDRIYTTNAFVDGIENSKNVTILKLEQVFANKL